MLFNLRPLVWRPSRGSILSLRASICVHDHPRLRFEPPRLLNFYFNADLDPALFSYTDPDPASKINADQLRTLDFWNKNPPIVLLECTFLYLSIPPFSPFSLSYFRMSHPPPPTLRRVPLLCLPRYLHFHHHLLSPSVSQRMKKN